ncbi:hypothetical protein JCM10450v2_006054 [Rhodotorula kratochvilovae]
MCPDDNKTVTAHRVRVSTEARAFADALTKFLQSSTRNWKTAFGDRAIAPFGGAGRAAAQGRGRGKAAGQPGDRATSQEGDAHKARLAAAERALYNLDEAMCANLQVYRVTVLVELAKVEGVLHALADCAAVSDITELGNKRLASVTELGLDLWHPPKRDSLKMEALITADILDDRLLEPLARQFAHYARPGGAQPAMHWANWTDWTAILLRALAPAPSLPGGQTRAVLEASLWAESEREGATAKELWQYVAVHCLELLDALIVSLLRAAVIEKEHITEAVEQHKQRGSPTGIAYAKTIDKDTAHLALPGPVVGDTFNASYRDPYESVCNANSGEFFRTRAGRDFAARIGEVIEDLCNSVPPPGEDRYTITSLGKLTAKWAADPRYAQHQAVLHFDAATGTYKNSQLKVVRDKLDTLFVDFAAGKLTSQRSKKPPGTTITRPVYEAYEWRMHDALGAFAGVARFYDPTRGMAGIPPELARSLVPDAAVDRRKYLDQLPRDVLLDSISALLDTVAYALHAAQRETWPCPSCDTTPMVEASETTLAWVGADEEGMGMGEHRLGIAAEDEVSDEDQHKKDTPGSSHPKDKGKGKAKEKEQDEPKCGAAMLTDMIAALLACADPAAVPEGSQNATTSLGHAVKRGHTLAVPLELPESAAVRAAHAHPPQKRRTASQSGPPQKRPKSRIKVAPGPSSNK